MKQCYFQMRKLKFMLDRFPNARAWVLFEIIPSMVRFGEDTYKTVVSEAKEIRETLSAFIDGAAPDAIGLLDWMTMTLYPAAQNLTPEDAGTRHTFVENLAHLKGTWKRCAPLLLLSEHTTWKADQGFERLWKAVHSWQGQDGEQLLKDMAGEVTDREETLSMQDQMRAAEGLLSELGSLNGDYYSMAEENLNLVREANQTINSLETALELHSTMNSVSVEDLRLATELLSASRSLLESMATSSGPGAGPEASETARLKIKARLRQLTSCAAGFCRELGRLSTKHARTEDDDPSMTQESSRSNGSSKRRRTK